MTVQRDFTEEEITVLASRGKKVDEKLLFLENVEKKCKDMFRGQLKIFQSTKRSRNENNRKAQKRKAAREEDNFDLIVKQLSDGKTPSLSRKLMYKHSCLLKENNSTGSDE